MSQPLDFVFEGRVPMVNFLDYGVDIGELTPKELYNKLKAEVYRDEYCVDNSHGIANYVLVRGETQVHLYRYLDGVTFVLTLTYTPVGGPERVLEFVDRVEDGEFFFYTQL